MMAEVPIADTTARNFPGIVGKTSSDRDVAIQLNRLSKDSRIAVMMRMTPVH